MIVLDASALLEFLLQTPLGTRVEARLFRDGDEFHSPHLVDVEWLKASDASSGRARCHVTERPTRLPISPPSISTVTPISTSCIARGSCGERHGVRCHDIALGEALDASIVTCDTPLGRAPGHRTDIEVIA